RKIEARGMSEPKIIVLDDAQALYKRAAEEIVHLSGDAICTHAEFTLCLSGGSTPAAVYELLGSRFLLSVDWNEVQFFWGDERCVPPDNDKSNYHMTQRTLLSKLPIKPLQIHRIRGEEAPAKAAQLYEEEIGNHFGSAGFPRFDLCLMGLGENSHTASLFPHNPVLHETEHIACAVEVDDPTERHRVTLTAPVFNQAANVIFLVSGESKAQAVWNVLKGPRNLEEFPAQLIKPANGELIWLLDRAAASKIG
ncbi:MAG TPA: 6-phosphogluconolactonase, partial [Candidatus Binataceae bacterium]|nr:6-phosphogluconolactonase [Candidatus Binataceae bacterium]